MRCSGGFEQINDRDFKCSSEQANDQIHDQDPITSKK